MSGAPELNADAEQGRLNAAALAAALKSCGDDWYDMVSQRCPHLFAGVAVFVDAKRMSQMTDVICAVERVVNNEKWMTLQPQCGRTRGVFYGYDFHVDDDSAHLIEINTNAGGAFFNALLGQSQASSDAWQDILAMFAAEWRMARGDAKLSHIAIVDEAPEEQYLYPEFLLAKALFERSGICAHIAAPEDFDLREDGLYLGDAKIDLVYNRLTDFSLARYPNLSAAWGDGRVVLTPDPSHYARYADKRNLSRLTDAGLLREIGVTEADIAVLQAGIPHTFEVRPQMQEALWDARKGLFFKPVDGYGSRGAYRGDKLTRRVFGEILQSEYVAQELAPPGERTVGDGVKLKYDIRCYVYDGKVQQVAARLYQGQTTNFRTEGGGFAPVRMVG